MIFDKFVLQEYLKEEENDEQLYSLLDWYCIMHSIRGLECNTLN